MNEFQAMLNEMSAQWQKDRADTQMTLGGLISALESMEDDRLIDGITEPESYRGYYSDLAFERTKDKITAKDALELCKSCMGKVFEGYKGGDFVMGELTPVWIAYYGDLGERILSIDGEGVIVTAKEDY